MTVSRLVFSSLFLLITLCSIAQEEENTADLPGWKLKNMVDGYTAVKDYYTAIDVAEIYHKRFPERTGMSVKLAKLYLLSRNYEGAVYHYRKLYDGDFKDDAEVHFYLAVALKRTGRYSEAQGMFINFKRKYNRNRKTENLYIELENELLGCDMALTVKPDTNLVLMHLNDAVNYPHMDFAPFPYTDSLLFFASLRQNDPVYDPENLPLRQFYLAEKIKDSTYQQTDFNFPFNDSAAHCGNGVFSKNRLMFVYTRCGSSKEGKPIHCELWWSTRNDSVSPWSKPVIIPGSVNVSTFNSSYPGFGKDSKNNTVLYFSSNRPGGRGGMDIWYVVYDDAKKRFKTPKNCGKLINTAKDEVSPFCFPDKKTFFYSSEGLIGFGGFDIYRTEGELKRWNTPRNVGLPRNSEADDLQYVLKKDGESGYLVSNRLGGAALENGTCCDDIYEFYVKKPLTINLIGTVVENTEMAPGEVFKSEGSVGLYLDIENKLVLVDKKTLPSPMSFNFALELNAKYRLIAERPGFLKSSKTISTIGLDHTDTIFVTPEIKAVSDAPIIIKNIYYPFDKDYLSSESKENLDLTIFKLMNDNPEIIVEIGSHTDGLGSAAYNDDLSQRRAQNVVNYLISLGIDKSRLRAKGYGSRVPLAANTKSDGSDNPEGRQKNRRTEFKIIGVIPGAAEPIYEE